MANRPPPRKVANNRVYSASAACAFSVKSRFVADADTFAKEEDGTHVSDRKTNMRSTRGVLAGGIVIVKSAWCRSRSRRFATTGYLYRLYRVSGMERVDKGRWGWGDDAARLEAQTGE